MILKNNRGLALLEKVQKVSKAKLKIIHVICNPYDNISTLVLHQVKRKNQDLTVKLFKEKSELYLRKVKTNDRLKIHLPEAVVDVRLEDVIANPKKELRRICNYLEISYTEEYIENSASIIWKKTNKSRHNLPFRTDDYVQKISNSIKQYDFLSRYNYKD